MLPIKAGWYWVKNPKTNEEPHIVQVYLDKQWNDLSVKVAGCGGFRSLKDYTHWIWDEITQRPFQPTIQSSGFTTYSGECCELCGKVSCRGGCFK